MKRLLLGVFAILLISTAGLWSQGGLEIPGFVFERESRNPITHFRFPKQSERFQFAIVSDRTGGHREKVFSTAVEKLNLMQPEFVVSVGDLIEGSTDAKKVDGEWKEFVSYASRLTMPFFYVAGNHDLGNAVTTKLWGERFGRSYYHFTYKNTLFLILNTDDPPTTGSRISDTQVEWAKKVLADNAKVDWTLVFVHRPLWRINEGKTNGFGQVEQALQGRNFTVFAGHVHRYEKFVRKGMNYYQLATTGGSSTLRGVEQGEFDQIVWVTQRKKDGPVLANVLLDSIYTEDLKPIESDEPAVVRKAKNLPTIVVQGKAHFEGVPMTGARVVFVPAAAKGGKIADGVVAEDGSFELTSYKSRDGAAQGDYKVVIDWRAFKNRVIGSLPNEYTTADTTPLRATVRSRQADIQLELSRKK